VPTADRRRQVVRRAPRAARRRSRRGRTVGRLAPRRRRRPAVDADDGRLRGGVDRADHAVRRVRRHSVTAGPSMRWLERRSWAVLVALAYVPALLSGRGRMPADSKLYLYLDPGRFLGDAAASFDPRQFAGWVPHQHVAYLWPAGPWFWLFEALGVPDWVAHRLWIGTLLAAAGLGVRWCARTLGLTPAAALAAAFVYQLSPYLLPCVSRTSVMLLPWAGLGWIVGLTVRATRRADTESRLARWLDPAALALVVLTVGAVNATALAMIVPAPVLWLVHAMWLGDVRWRPALGVAARTALLSAGVSVWWIAMLMIQGRYGA